MKNIASVEMGSYGYDSKTVTETMFHEYMDKIYSEKETVLRCRMAELGIDLDLEKDSKRRFKSLLVENKGGEESYWYNDGSENGLRIITFITEIGKPEMGEISCSLKAEIKYY